MWTVGVTSCSSPGLILTEENLFQGSNCASSWWSPQPLGLACSSQGLGPLVACMYTRLGPHPGPCLGHLCSREPVLATPICLALCLRPLGAGSCEISLSGYTGAAISIVGQEAKYYARKQSVIYKMLVLRLSEKSHQTTVAAVQVIFVVCFVLRRHLVLNKVQPWHLFTSQS